MATCSVCFEDLPSDFAVCSLNNCKLHFACAGTSEATWRKSGNKRTWKCPPCRASGPKVPDPAPVTGEELRQFMGEVRTQMKVLKDLEELKPMVVSLEESVQHMSNQYDDLMSELKSQGTTVKQLEKQVETLTETAKEKDNVIVGLKERLNEVEQYARNKNLEISGIQEVKNENLKDIMCVLSTILQIDYKPDDVDVIHRIPSRNPKVPAKIVAQFTQRSKRNLWLQNKKHGIVSSDVTSSEENTKVYISEHLTAEWKKLLWMTKQKGRELGYKAIWYRDGKIFVKKDFNVKEVIRITTERDLAKL
ncbi:putative 11.0 kDa protein in cwlL 5'region [Frankliniella fusca]|nr:putative 11.0 kDa protein in cwlL 5'region [Frankliniella fusca]